MYDKEIVQIHMSDSIYQLIKKYRKVDTDTNLCHSRGILTTKETWLLDNLEKIIFGKTLC